MPILPRYSKRIAPNGKRVKKMRKKDGKAVVDIWFQIDCAADGDDEKIKKIFNDLVTNNKIFTDSQSGKVVILDAKLRMGHEWGGK